MSTIAMQSDPFQDAMKGSFKSVLKWPQLSEFWARLTEQADDHWYVYPVGESVPAATLARQELLDFIGEIDALLHREHEHDYCGIVYVDDLQTPSIIKVYDPNNLGVSCGFSTNPPLPGWVISRLSPSLLLSAQAQTGSRRRWWNKILGKK